MRVCNQLITKFFLLWVNSMILMLFLLNPNKCQAKEYLRLPGVIHVHSQFSSGDYSIKELVEKSKEKGIEVLILSDHDLVVMEYGIPPLRNILKKREERKSVLQIGVKKFLGEINRINQKQKDVIVIPGVQSSPFYYWTGNPIKKNLTAHEYRKELLLLGLSSAEDYENLPVMHRGISTIYIKELLPRAVVFFISFILGVFLIFQKGFLRKTGMIISLLSALLMINHHPFQSSKFDPYHGDKGIAPFQEMIEYVKKRNGLVFWAHPESNYSRKGVKLGPIYLKTGHYANDLFIATNYTGFSVLYGDTVTMVNPGMHWDRLLKEYCRKERTHPVWGIGGSDFHVEKKGHDIDTFQTVFLVAKKTKKDIFDALSKGRIYAMRKVEEEYLTLKYFRVRDKKSGQTAIMGEEIKMKNIPVVSGRIDGARDQKYQIQITLIRGGKVWQEIKGKTPIQFSFEDTEWQGKKTYYRFEAKGKKSGRLITNPVFIKGFSPN